MTTATTPARSLPDSPPGAGTLLYISYDGVLAGPGRSQTLPYLRGYAEAGWSARLLSYEKPDVSGDTGRVEAVASELEAAGVRWTRLPWRGSPLRDLVAGLRAVRRIVAAERPDVIHARSYVPALLGDFAGRRHGARLLFDMRGFWPDERVDGGLWSAGHPLYRLWKRIERRLLRRSDAVVTLARAGLDVLHAEELLAPDVPHAVIYCGADLDRFRPVAPAGRPDELRDWADRRVWTFLGATGTWYLLDAMLDFVADTAVAEPDDRFLFLTEDPQDRIRAGLAKRGVAPERVRLLRVDHERVPAWISGSHAGVFFIRPVRSKKASCPTKLAEFLACGVPVVINVGIGDTEAIVADGRAGVVLRELDAAAFADGRRTVAELHGEPELAGRLRSVAEKTFDARDGARRFASLAAGLVAS